MVGGEKYIKPRYDIKVNKESQEIRTNLNLFNVTMTEGVNLLLKKRINFWRKQKNEKRRRKKDVEYYKSVFKR